MKLQTALALGVVSFASVALAGEGTIMRIPGEISSGNEAKIVVLKVAIQDFEAIKGENGAEVGDTQVQALRQSSEAAMEGETLDGRPVVILKGMSN